MPKIKSAKQYGFMQAIAHGSPRLGAKGLPASKAREGIMELSPEKRSGFAKAIKRKRKIRFPSAPK